MTVSLRYFISVAGLAIVLSSVWAMGQTSRPDGTRQAATADTRPATRPGPRRRPPTYTPTHPADIVLGRPTASSIVLNVLCDSDLQAVVAYGTQVAELSARTDVKTFKKVQPQEVTLEKLKADTQYYYQLLEGGTDKLLVQGMFHTQRAAGSGFVFEIQGDSHPERPEDHDQALYAQTLKAAAADHPDFYMTIGDDFSVDTLQLPAAAAGQELVVDRGADPSRMFCAENVAGRYLLQRPYLSLVGAPVFLVNGNHEQAALCNLDGTANNVAVWAQNARNRFYPQPEPDGFYTGDATPVQFIGALRDYYAWTWGDALFVVIDPYWHSPKPVDNVFGGGAKTRDRWAVTLGDEQYKWLKKTLETSKASYKFVFSHHVLGTGRGGIEEAGMFEWGGKDRRGVDDFAQKRPGWELPIHQLMVKNGVTIFFQGHDHIFARQQLDGVIYQSLPEPADPSYSLLNKDAYLTGDIFPNSGRVRVTVSAEKVRVEYVRSYLPKDATAEHPNGEVAFSYEIAAGKAGATSAPGK